MAELEPTPEREVRPLSQTCLNDECQTEFQLTGENTRGFYYEKQVECSNIVCGCPNCGLKMRLHCSEDYLKQVIENGIYVDMDELYAPDHVYEGWLGVKGIELVETYQLTDRHEKLIGQFATALANAPDEHLYDLITDDGYNQPYPRRWI